MPTGTPYNPFTELATPEVLGLQRELIGEKRYEGTNFWVQEAARSGRSFRKNMLERGIPFSQEDEKALRNQNLLQAIGKETSQLMEAGELSPENAETYLMQNVYNGLLTDGDYEGASQIAPQLQALYEKRAAILKLRAEAANQTSERTRREILLPGEIEESRTKSILQEAQAGQANRSPQPRAPGKAGSMGQVAERQFTTQIASARGAMQRLTDLATLVTIKAPGIGGPAAKGIAGVQDFVNSTTQLMGGGRNSVMENNPYLDPAVKEENFKTERTREADINSKYKEFKTKHKDDPSININYGLYKSLVMDLAYALAKARDSGGRLSDADVNNAMEILGASGDSARMGTVLRKVGSQLMQDVENQISSNTDYQHEKFKAGVDGLREDFRNFQAVYGKPSASTRRTQPATSSGPKTRNSAANAPTRTSASEDGGEILEYDIGGSTVSITGLDGLTTEEEE